MDSLSQSLIRLKSSSFSKFGTKLTFLLMYKVTSVKARIILSWKCENSWVRRISWVEKRKTNPTIKRITVKMVRKAATILFIHQASNFFTTGNRIKDISKANAIGMRIGFANSKMAKNENTVAIAKNSFWKDRCISEIIKWMV